MANRKSLFDLFDTIEKESSQHAELFRELRQELKEI